MASFLLHFGLTKIEYQYSTGSMLVVPSYSEEIESLILSIDYDDDHLANHDLANHDLVPAWKMAGSLQVPDC